MMTSQMNRESMICVFNPAPNSNVRIVCCPQVGASATAYTHLSAALPPSIEALSIQYPGRQGSRQESGFRDIRVLAEQICTELRPWADRPLVLFGHSMGAAVAFEVARELADTGITPARLFVSGRAAPSLKLDARILVSDEDFVAELNRLGEIPSKLLDRPKYRKAILSVVRSDYEANRSYQCAPRVSIKCPITFLLADADPYVDHELALAWQKHTSAEFRIAPFVGGHSFLNEQLPDVVDEIVHDLRGCD